LKLQVRQIESFLAGGAETVAAVLFYGPDTGLVRERADALAKKAVDDPNDPFNVSLLSQDAILDDPAILADDLGAMSLGGGRRLVIVSDASERLTKAVENALETASLSSLLILKAGDLNPRNALRRLAEGAEMMAAVPCYLDDDRSLGRVIDDALREAQIQCDPDARRYLEQSLGNDRAVTKSELEKLVLYAGPGGRLGLDDVTAIVGDNAAMTLADIAMSAADGDAGQLDRLFNQCMTEGIAAVGILRAVSDHLMRLQITEARMRNGEAPDQAMKALRLPVFFKEADRFRRQLSRWRGPGIAQGLSLVLAAERDCKKTGAPEEAICGRTLHQIAAIGRRGARR
jgi:DNA polymerase-3 subunit delta